MRSKEKVSTLKAGAFFAIFLFVALPYSLAFASSDSEWSDWQEAKRLYDEQKLEESLQQFLSHPKESAAYYFNVGTLHYQLRHTKLALAYLQKAARLDPSDSDISKNLSMTRKSFQKSHSDSLSAESSSWLEELGDFLSEYPIQVSLSLLYLFLTLYCLRSYLQTRNLRIWLKCNQSVLFAAVSISFLFLFIAQKWAASHPVAVCIENLSVKSGPAPHFFELSQLEEGQSIRVLGSPTSTPTHEKTELWIQIRYSKDGIGWVSSKGLLVL